MPLQDFHPAARLPRISWTAGRTATRMAWLAGLLFAVCTVGGPGRAHAQQSSQNQNSSQSAQPASPAQAPAAQTTQSGPMVLGAGPDASDDSDSAPPPAGNSSQPSAAPPQGNLAPWPSPAGAAAVAGPQPPPTQPSPPVSALVPVPPPANAGGDAARQQINNECVDLLKMANDLKSAVDKTNKDMLSVQVVRTANQIEQLARRVKDEIRPAVARN